MNRLISIALLLIMLLLVGCNESPNNTGNKGGKTATSEEDLVDDDSLPIDEKELKELNEPAAKPAAEGEKAIELLRRFQIGQSLDDVRKSLPNELKLGEPTTNVPIGELPEDELVVEFKGDISGYFHFNGSTKNVGQLIMVEVFTDNRSYKNGANKQRIRSFVKLLGKPKSIRKDEEDEEGEPIYVVDWQNGNQAIRYQDEPEWGSTISLIPKN